MTKTQEDRFIRDISAIRKSLQSIAEDLRYFRKKEEAEAVDEEKKEEPKYTCRDCTRYRKLFICGPNETAHWCILRCCSISEEGLEAICDDFEKDGEFRCNKMK